MIINECKMENIETRKPENVQKLISDLVSQNGTQEQNKTLFSIHDVLKCNESVNIWKIILSENGLPEVDQGDINEFVYFLFKKHFKHELERRPSYIQKKIKPSRVDIITEDIIQRLVFFKCSPLIFYL